jgi:hypothetical protein
MSGQVVPALNISYFSSSLNSSFISASDGHANNLPSVVVLSNCLSPKNPQQDQVFNQIFKKIGKILIPKIGYSFTTGLKIGSGVYSGQIKDGQPFGLGSWFSEMNYKYYGEWKCGFPSGLGYLDCQKEGTYIGKFKKGKYSGFGQFFVDKTYYYIGRWKNNKKHGFGEEYSDGILYKGQFRNGLRHGAGEFEKGPWRVSGLFDSDSLIYGKSFDAQSGCKYEGQWQNFKSHGKGIIRYSKQSGSFFRRLSGYFKNGEFVYGKGKIMGSDQVITVKTRRS